MSPKNTTQETLDDLLEKLSRHDERINSLLNEKENMHNKIDALYQSIQDLKLNIESYKLKLENMHGFWERIFDGGWKIGLMVLGAFILYMLKLQSPSN